MSEGLKTAAAGWLVSHIPLRSDAAEIQSDCYALNPVSPWVENNWNPPVGVIDDAENCKLNFGVMSWNFQKQGAVIKRIGSCGILRRSLRRQVDYEWSVSRYFYSARGRFICEPHDGEPVRSWTVRESSEMVGSTRTMSSSGKGAPSGQILAMAALLGSRAASDAWIDRQQSFQYTVTGKEILNGCRLEHDSVAEKSLPAGWQSLLLTGRGCLPSHLLRDAAGRPLFFTAFGLSYVLEGIDDV